jgi:hypothetical protein
MHARLDSFGIWDAVRDAARSIADAAVEGWTGTASARITPEPPPPHRDTTLDTKMNALLSRALEQSTASGRDELFHRILDQIVPDEARIISALSDGSSSPMISVHALNRAGLLGEALIENASLIGRAANVALPALTPTYVGHLLALGLLETRPEDDAMKDEYQILLADSGVLRAIREGSIGPVPARVEKRTVRLSTLGLALWTASNGSRP